MRKHMLMLFGAVALLCVGFVCGDVHHEMNAPVIESISAPATFELPARDVHWSGTKLPTGTDAQVLLVDNPTPAPAPTPAPTQSVAMYLLSNIVYILGAAIAAVTAAVINCVLVLIAKHFNIVLSQNEHNLITDMAETAVTRAETWASALKDTPSSNDKLNFAVNALSQLASSATGKTFTDTTLTHYVEEAVYKLFNQPDPNDPAPAPAQLKKE